MYGQVVMIKRLHSYWKGWCRSMENYIEDIYGRTHVISEEIARGGQGVVYRTIDSNIAIKIEINPITGEAILDESNNEKFNDIRLLPIPERINITLPTTTLRSCSGYVMTLLEDMESFSKAFDKELEDMYLNKWLESFVESNEECVKGLGNYISTGGKRRRLIAYLKCACIIAKLHANGLVYCDFSPNNVFISSDFSFSNVWLIDADNLNYQNITINSGYYTPGYAAPEVVNGKGCTFYSDSYSFAISLFWQLTGTHPFRGQLVENAMEEDFADDIEEKANNGELPWIADIDDESNFTGTSIPYELILSKRMMSNFDKTFSKLGREKRYTRTSIFEWAEILASESDNSIKCQHCEMEYVSGTTDSCPWCDRNNKLINIESYYFNQKNKGCSIWSYSQEIDENMTKHIPFRIANGFEIDGVDSFVFDIEMKDEKLILSNISLDCEISLSNINGSDVRLSGKTMIEQNSKLICKINKTNEIVLIEVDVI